MIAAFTTRKNDTLKSNLIHLNIVFPLYTAASFDSPSFSVIFFTSFPSEGFKKVVTLPCFQPPTPPLASDKSVVVQQQGQ